MNKSGINVLTTTRGNKKLGKDLHIVGKTFGSHAFGKPAINHSEYMNAVAYLNEEQAGVWNFSMKTSVECFSSMFILEGDFSWDSLKQSDKTISLEGLSKDKVATENGVLDYSMEDFMKMVKTKYPSSKITNILKDNLGDNKQVSGSFKFEPYKVYSVLIAWSHSGKRAGLDNMANRFGFWKNGDSIVVLPEGGISNMRGATGKGTSRRPFFVKSGDNIPVWFYTTFNGDIVNEVLNKVEEHVEEQLLEASEKVNMVKEEVKDLKKDLKKDVKSIKKGIKGIKKNVKRRAGRFSRMFF